MKMHAKIITVYAAYTTVNEAGSIGSCLGYYSHSPDAFNRIKGKGFYGGSGEVVTKYAIAVGVEYFLLESVTPIDLDDSKRFDVNEIRKKALEKLTQEEKDVLGIK